MKVRLHSIKIKNFRAISEFSYTFPETGLLLVCGPSGNGKSTLFHAIHYALGDSIFSAAHIQSWYDAIPFSVELVIKVDDKLYTIERSAKTVSLKGPDLDIKGGKTVDENLSRILGSAFRNFCLYLAYRPQRSRNIFLSKGDTEKKEFLTQLLGLDRFEKAYADATRLCNQLKTTSDILDQQLESKKASLSSFLPVEPTLIQEDNSKAERIELAIIEAEKAVEEKAATLASVNELFNKRVAEVMGEIPQTAKKQELTKSIVREIEVSFLE